MEELMLIYKILNIVRENMDNPESYDSQISPEALGLSEPKWSRVMAMIHDAGYLEGVVNVRPFDPSEAKEYPMVVVKRPEITLKGLTYLEEAKEALKYNLEFEFDTSSLDEVEKRIERLAEHLDKALELAESIASLNIDLRVNSVINNKQIEMGSITRTIEGTKEKIQSLNFDAELGCLEINGKKFEKAIIVRWPRTLDNDAWQSGLLINESKEEGINRFERREGLPILEITFKDGTGSFKIR